MKNEKHGLYLFRGITLVFLMLMSWKYINVLKEKNTLEKEKLISASQIDIPDKILKCNQLYELKKVKYWGIEIGQNSAIYSQNLNTCLALNIYNNFETKKYTGMVIDMANDKTLLYYSSTPNGVYYEGENSNKKITCNDTYDYLSFTKDNQEVKDFGCEKYKLLDEMFAQIRSFGFTVFSG